MSKYLLLWLFIPSVTLPSSLCDTNGKRFIAIAPWLSSSSRLYKDFTGNKNDLQWQRRFCWQTQFSATETLQILSLWLAYPSTVGLRSTTKSLGKSSTKLLPNLSYKEMKKKPAQQRGSVNKASTAAVENVEDKAKQIILEQSQQWSPLPTRRAKACL